MLELPEPQDDGLALREVNSASSSKHHFLQRYMHAFVTAMKDKWGELHYIDLFAGPGIERFKSERSLAWGSPLIAVHMMPPFDQLHFCELNEECYRTLQERINIYGATERTQLLKGDANNRVEELVHQLPSNSLSLAFLDPTGLHVQFETVIALSRRKIDLIIFFPDHLDIIRNWKNTYYEKPQSNLDKFYGPGKDWRSIFDELPDSKWLEEIRNLYIERLRTIGFGYCASERVYRSGNHPLYHLIYASKHPIGKKLWQNIAKKKPDNQSEFDWGD